MTKFPVFGVLLAMVFLSASPIKGQADTVGSYGDTGSVGFTGKMPEKPTPPPQVTLPPKDKDVLVPPKPSTPINIPNGGTQIVTLPATGDSSNKVYFVTATLFVVFILFLTEKMIKNKRLQKLNL